MNRNFLAFHLPLAVLLIAPAVRAEFALRDGDTVAFFGDSITAARGYTKVVENYTLLRYPDRKVRFLNAGQGGDTAFASLTRLERDVFAPGATVMTAAFGINDIGWGMRADEEHKQQYLDGIRGLVEACRKHDVRVFICSPAITAEDPDRAEKGFLQTMVDEGLALAKSLGAETIDLQRGMRSVQRRMVMANASETDPEKHTTLHVKDGVHLNDLGQLAMGFAMLKGLGAPAEVSFAAVDAAGEGMLVEAAGCRVTDVAWKNGAFRFTRLDDGLPLNLGILGALNFRFIPIPEELNQYRLKVLHLPPGDYELRAENRLLGTVSARRLSEGLNIASMTADGWEPGGPWDAQAGIVKELTDARDKLWMGGVLRNRFLGEHPRDRKLDRATERLDDDLVDLQRATARPYPYHFELRQIPAPAAAP